MFLTLDAALGGCGAGVVRDGAVLAERRLDGARGSAAALPALAEAVLREAGIAAAGLDAVAVTVGPGSFTGVRAGLALAHGIGVAAEIPVLGVSVGAAFRAGVAGSLGEGRRLWVAIDSRRGRVFLDDGASLLAVGLDDLPVPGGAVAVAGDAAVAVAGRLAALGADVLLLDVRRVNAAWIARAAGRPMAARPLYVDGPEARPGAGMRPLPA